ncbi:MAG: Ig-like domain-containing protein [Caldilineaceae bacterium]
MKNKWFTWTIGALLVAGLAVMGLLVVNGRELWGLEVIQRTSLEGASNTLVQSGANSAQIQPAESNANQFVGDYSGVVKLNTTVIGVYSETLTIPPSEAGKSPDLGSIDLSITLDQNNNTLNGYVSLDKTLVYSVEHTLGLGAAAIKIGPYLSGVVNGANISVQSEKSSLVVDARALQRQFRLVTTNVANDGGELNGEYRETLWGYTSAPVTVIGAFTLHRTGSNAIAPVLEPTAPNVVADTATTTQGKAVTINALANDSTATGGTLTITAVGKPQFGAATTDGKSVTYTPSANFTGTDTFSYVVSDGKGGTSTGSVTVTVNGPGGPNQPPTATNDAAVTAPGVAVLIDVLANDSDANGDALSISIDGAPQHGTAVVQNGKVLYTPNAGFSGADSFTYIISDGHGGTATGSVTVTVKGPSGGATIYLPLVQR